MTLDLAPALTGIVAPACLAFDGVSIVEHDHRLDAAFAQEVASRNITVNCVAPGFMVSAMTDALTDAQKEGIFSKIPMGAMGTGDDIGAAVVYLASDEAGYVTGQTLHVNGGMVMP